MKSDDSLDQVSLHGLSHSTASCILSMFIQWFCVGLYLVCIAHGIAALEVSTKILSLMSSMLRARLISRLARAPHIANGRPTQPHGKNNNKKRETKQVGKIRKVFAARSMMHSPEHRQNCRLQVGRGTRACSASLVRAHSYKCHSPSRAWIGFLTRNSPLDGDGRASQVLPIVNLHGIRLHHCLLRNQIEITTVSPRSTF